MAFSTTSYMAGIGSVVVVLSTGFAGGYFLANPTQNDPPNRLQRVVASAPPPASAAQPTNPPQREVAEAAPSATLAAVAPPQPSATPAAAPPQPTPPEPTPPAVQQAPVSVAPVASKEPEPDRGAAEQDRQRAADAARSAEKKKIEARKIAERQRRHRDIEYAAAAVKRMLHDRDAREMVENDGPDTAAPEAPRFVLFGQ
jgi:hypothetical protein